MDTSLRLASAWQADFHRSKEKALPIGVSSACRAVVRQLPDEGWCQSVASSRPISLLLSYPCHPSNPWFPFRGGSAALGNPWLDRELRPAQVGAGAGINLNHFAFLDEERNVDRLAGFQFGRLGHIAGGVTTQALWRFDDF